jgi:hypothetical protein
MVFKQDLAFNKRRLFIFDFLVQTSLNIFHHPVKIIGFKKSKYQNYAPSIWYIF